MVLVRLKVPQSKLEPRFARAVITNPPSPTGYTSNKDSMGGFGQLYPAGAPPAPPLDLPYLAAYLRTAGVALTVIDAGADALTVQGFVARLKATPNIENSLCLVRTSLPTIDWDLEVCARIRRECPVGGVALIGSVVSSLWSRIRHDTSIDFAISGEPDVPVLELVQGVPLSDIAGLRWRDGSAWKENPERPFEKNLDDLPIPAWDLFPHAAYTIPRSSNTGIMRFLPMLSSRGCPFGCNYCPYPVGQGLKWRFRSPKNVVDEMEYLVRTYKVEYILFRDPMFSARQARVRDICAEIMRRELKVEWRCETRIDCLDEQTIAAMAKAGCTGVNFGVESTDPEVLRNVERHPITPEEAREKVALCRKYGIQTFAFFIVGLPGDTVDTILDSMEFAVDLDAGWVQFTVSTPFIGTKLHQWAARTGRIAPDFYKIISAHEGSVGNENLTPARIHALHVLARFIQNNLLNRRGILKNKRRQDLPYVIAKKSVDWVGNRVAKSLVRGARVAFSVTGSVGTPAATS